MVPMIAARCCRLETFPVVTSIQSLYAWDNTLDGGSMCSCLINLYIYKWMTADVFIVVKKILLPMAFGSTNSIQWVVHLYFEPRHFIHVSFQFSI